MPLVNLIAVQRFRRRVAIRRTRAIMLVWLLELIGCTTLLLGMFWEVTAQTNRLADFQAKSANMRPYKMAISEGQHTLDQLQPRLDTLTTAFHFTDQWTRILEHVSTHLPQGSWLTSVRTQEGKQEGDATEIIFMGYAMDQTIAGDVMSRLTECGDLTGIELRYTKEKQASDYMGVEFEIHAKLAGTQEKQDKKADEGDKNANA